MEADGKVTLVDRTKDMILVSGFNVYPNEVEGVCAEHPGVVEAACIGIPDERTGEAVKVFVVRRNPALQADELIAHCRMFLTSYKVPRQVEFVPDLPKSAVGKILRRALR
jgi:long-chain acyl-CoA synthetase